MWWVRTNLLFPVPYLFLLSSFPWPHSAGPSAAPVTLQPFSSTSGLAPRNSLQKTTGGGERCRCRCCKRGGHRRTGREGAATAGRQSCNHPPEMLPPVAVGATTTCRWSCIHRHLTTESCNRALGKLQPAASKAATGVSACAGTACHDASRRQRSY